ncbi:MAG: BON domain-containing protein [Bdellovibrionales bacterium]
MMLTSRFARFLAVPFFVLSIAGCAAFEGRETAGQYVDDTTITAKVKQAFIADPQVNAMAVNVETMQGVVQLSGFVDSTTSAQRAEQLAQQVSGVKSVKNTIVVRRKK